jgi:hypothetical protein
MIGKLKGFGEVVIIKGIITFYHGASGRTLPCDHSAKEGFTVHKTDGSKRRFIQSDRGLYLDVGRTKSEKIEKTVTLRIQWNDNYVAHYCN